MMISAGFSADKVRSGLCMKDKNRSTKDVGPAYRGLKWLDETGREKAKKNREKLLKSLPEGVRYSFSQNKLHIGKLSPGCLTCGQGYWSCIFINGLCTANCFYCPQDRGMKKERKPLAEGVTFDNPKDYADYLDKFDFKGVGFSGGESLLVFEKLLAYVKEIKGRFGNRIYVWIYTNGDLVDKDKLRKLKEAGLDEIRFNISVRGYDLSKVKPAVGIINKVTIEIPAIPEDYEKVKKTLRKMHKIGVDHLNLHQLEITAYNCKNFIGRNYSFLRLPSVVVLESEFFALKIIRYALNNKIDLPINYCAKSYKSRFQKMGLMQRRASLVKESFEDLTDTGYIRRLSDGRLTKGRADTGGRALVVNYYAPQIYAGAKPGGGSVRIKFPSGKTISIFKKPVLELKTSAPADEAVLRKLLLKQISAEEALKHFLNNCAMNSKNYVKNIQEHIGNFKAIESMETLEEGFPEIY